MTRSLFRSAAFAATLLGLAGVAGATGIADDFESYLSGSFPGPLWQDVGALDPQPPVSPLPSALVVDTIDAHGDPTRAAAVVDAVALVSGLYQPVALSTSYSLAADIRIDRFSNNPENTTSDWGMQLTFAQTSRNLYAAPQAGIYASSLTGGWRLFLLEDVGGLSADIDLGVGAVLGTWYRVSFDLDATNGDYRARIADAASGAVLVDAVGTFAGWSAGNGQYDAVAFFDGEGSLGATLGNLALVDNINVVAVPEPSTALLAAIGIAALGIARRRRR